MLKMKTIERPLFVSYFPSGRWVATGQNGEILTSKCDWEKSLKFARQNDVSPQAIERAREFTWPAQIFQISTEHKTEAGDHHRAARTLKEPVPHVPVTKKSFCGQLLGRFFSK